MAEDTQTHEDANELLNMCVNYARRMLKRYGEFGPFAFSLSPQRELVNETTAHKELPPDPAMLLELLQKQLTERGGKREILAAATAANVTMGKPSAEGFTDALMVEIEHQTGYCVKAFVPYRIGGGQFFRLLPRHIRFGAVQIQDGVTRFFAR
ncbi:MAG TPA: hypothetical protein VHB45_06020 [Alloacidobacterium sp.]|nr:hypothetical protein [Alloacidobacterium sp.]